MDSQELLELSVSPEEMCRTCLAPVDRTLLKPILCSEILDGSIVPFPKVVELATGEKFVKDDKLPNNVCVECKTKLRDFYIYVEKVRKSSNLLYEIFAVAKPAPPHAVVKKPQTNEAEVQTDPIVEAEEAKEATEHPTQPVVMVENGTQCDDAGSGPPASAEAACQTDLPPEKAKGEITTKCLNNVAATFKDIEKMSVIPVKNELPAFISNEQLQTHPIVDDDGSLTHDEDEYEMIMVAEEPSEEECYALSIVSSDKKNGNRTQIIDVNLAPKHPLDNIVATVPAHGKQGQKEECQYCNTSGRLRTFLTQEHFQIHKQTLELCFESIDYFRCAVCFMVFLSQTHFDAHCTEGCQPVLPEEYIEDADLRKHVSFYLQGLDVCVPKLKTFKWSSDHERYRCARCTKHSKSFDEIRRHFHSHEAEDDKAEDMNLLWKDNRLDKVHVCGICKGHFPDGLYIRQHLYFHQPNFFCPYECNTAFTKFSNLTKHIDRMHLQDAKAKVPATLNPEPMYQCERCEKCFCDTEALKTHMKRHYRERKYVCTVCKKCFAQKSDLTTHSRIHTDERPFPCEICGKMFRTTSHRRDHMSTHEVVNKYECDVCQKLFKAERILAGHKRLHTGEKPYQCEACPKVFARKQHLKLHSKTHLKAAEDAN